MSGEDMSITYNRPKQPQKGGWGPQKERSQSYENEF